MKFSYLNLKNILAYRYLNFVFSNCVDILGTNSIRLYCTVLEAYRYSERLVHKRVHRTKTSRRQERPFRRGIICKRAPTSGSQIPSEGNSDFPPPERTATQVTQPESHENKGLADTITTFRRKQEGKFRNTWLWKSLKEALSYSVYPVMNY